MKIEVPEYVLDAVIRHFDIIVKSCKAPIDDTRLADTLRLGKLDVDKLKRIKQQKK